MYVNLTMALDLCNLFLNNNYIKPYYVLLLFILLLQLTMTIPPSCILSVA